MLLWIVTAFSILYFIANLIGLDRSPTVWIDEVTLNDPARMLALHGQLGSSVFSGYEGFSHAYFWQPYGQALVTAVVYKVFGFGIWQTRIPPLTFAAASLPVLYLLFSKLFLRRVAAVIGCVLYALDVQFIETVRSGRMDAQCLFFSFLGLYCLLTGLDQKGTRRILFLAASGLSIGIAGTTHPVGIIWSLAGAIVIILTTKRNAAPLLVVFGSACAVAPATWVSYAAITGNLSTLRSQFLTHGESHVVTGSIFARFHAEFERYHTVYRYAPLLLVIYAVAVLWVTVIRRKQRAVGSTVAALFFIPFLFVTLFMVKTVGFYSLHPITIAAGCVGVLAEDLFALCRNNRWALVTFAVGVAIVSANIFAAGIGGRELVLVTQWRDRNYQQVSSAVDDYVASGCTVWGSPQVWYALEARHANLRLLGAPNAQIDDYVIESYGNRPPTGFRKLVTFGTTFRSGWLPIHLPTADYHLSLWRSSFRSSCS
jgi:4-amino-4-deoxy-L-arabinose transferase-like glycosyltransferase